MAGTSVASKKKQTVKKTGTGSESAVGTLERGLAILQFFKRTPEAGIADVAAALELSRSTTYRIAERLRELGFLEINTSTPCGAWAAKPRSWVSPLCSPRTSCGSRLPCCWICSKARAKR